MEDIQIDQLMVPFLALMAVISLIVLLLMKLSLPDIQGTRVEKGEKLEKSVWSFRHLTLGVVAIFFYVGVEVCIGANINLYAIEMDYASPALMATLYWGGMLVGRLVGRSLSRISPRVQLTVTTVSAGLLALLAILLNNPWLLTAVGVLPSHHVGSYLYFVRCPFGKIHFGGFGCVHDRSGGRCHIALGARSACQRCSLEAGDGHGSSCFLEKRLCCIMH